MIQESCNHCRGTGVEPDQKATGLLMRRRRQRRRMTIAEVAALMGVSMSYVSDLELGRRRWNKRLSDRFEAATLRQPYRASLGAAAKRGAQ